MGFRGPTRAERGGGGEAPRLRRMTMDYKSSGVDIDAGNEVVNRVKELARSTFTKGVVSDIGSFGGVFQPDFRGHREPVLVASTDGVGTKLRVAFLTGRHTTVGVDLVNHCVNDILVQGATPLFFLDYLATGRLSPDVSTAVIQGVATGCRENGCALLGGETAEMPGFYADGEYDIAGSIVGLADRTRLIDGRRIASGDCLIGLPSSGLHTNGFSLARQIIFERAGLTVDDRVEQLDPEASVGEVLLRAHRSYLSLLGPLLGAGLLKGLAHVTGGGITDNLPRILPRGLAAEVDRRAWEVPPVFAFLREAGEVPVDDMYRTFNMGMGMIVVCADSDVNTLRGSFAEAGEQASVVIGRVVDAGEEAPSVRYV